MIKESGVWAHVMDAFSETCQEEDLNQRDSTRIIVGLTRVFVSMIGEAEC